MKEILLGRGRHTISLERKPDNKTDPNAILVCASTCGLRPKRLGYVCKGAASALSPEMDRLGIKRLNCSIEFSCASSKFMYDIVKMDEMLSKYNNGMITDISE